MLKWLIVVEHNIVLSHLHKNYISLFVRDIVMFLLIVHLLCFFFFIFVFVYVWTVDIRNKITVSPIVKWTVQMVLLCVLWSLYVDDADPAEAQEFPMDYLEKVKTVHSVGGYGSQG